jgi:hypothetical protein
MRKPPVIIALIGSLLISFAWQPMAHARRECCCDPGVVPADAGTCCTEDHSTPSKSPHRDRHEPCDSCSMCNVIVPTLLGSSPPLDLTGSCPVLHVCASPPAELPSALTTPPVPPPRA